MRLGVGLTLVCMIAVAGSAKAVAPPVTRDGTNAELLATQVMNAEMKTLFDADQADRRNKDIDWVVVSKADKQRRFKTKTLIDAGALTSGADYEAAAFVFQHGQTPDDILYAHTLATVAIAKGRPQAIWIAAASLDRYLLRINQPQIYGTQYLKPEQAKKWSQEPYNRTLVSDSLRAALTVPPLAEQARTLEKF